MLSVIVNNLAQNQQSHSITFDILATVLLSLFVFASYFSYRNEAVFRFSMKTLHTNYRAFEKLPSYNHMLFFKFWVWSFDRFIE